MKKLIAAAALIVFASITSAGAADLPLPVKAPPPPPRIWSWTGFYAGGNGGYSWGDWDSTNVGGTSTFPGTSTALGSTASPDVKGWFGGLQAGYNYQLSPQWVIGVEGDFDWSGESASDLASASTSAPSSIVTGICDAHPICTTTITSATTNDWKLPWFATLRARGGFVADQTWLLYGTGGVAFAGTKFSTGATTTTTIVNGIGQTFPGFPVTTSSALSDTSDRVGFAVGGGVEKMLSQNWSVKAEYLFLDFGTHTFLAGTGFDTNVKLFDNIVRAGVNYKFWPNP